MPTIRVDGEVMEWLRRNAQPFSDTPNSVLRRFAGLDGEARDEGEETVIGTQEVRSRRKRTNSGRRLNREWKVKEEWNVEEENSRYHEGGTFYMPLREFPGALFDPEGFVVFRTEGEYLTAPGLHHGVRLNVPEGVSALRGYIKKRGSVATEAVQPADRR